MLDFQALCLEYNIPLIDKGHHHAHQGWVQTHCPFCTNGNHGWHLGFALEKGSFNCWRCGPHRTWEVMVKLLKSEKTVRQALSQHQTDRLTPPPQPKLRPKTLWTPPDIGPLHGIHKRYLKKRNFDPNKLEEEWGLKGTRHLSGAWNWRIIGTIQDRKGKSVSYFGRTIYPNLRPKYKMSDKQHIPIDPRGLLYGLHRTSNDFVVIVEGPTDVWRMGKGAVATLGIDWKVEQAVQLKNFSRRFIMYDPDCQAQRQAQKLASWLAVYKGSTEIIEQLPCDPGNLSQEDANELMKELRASDA